MAYPTPLLLPSIYSICSTFTSSWQSRHKTNKKQSAKLLEGCGTTKLCEAIPSPILIMNGQNNQDFEQIVKEEKDKGFLNELLLMLKYNKKWWLTPIILVLLLFGALIIMGGSSYAPFIYTLF